MKEMKGSCICFTLRLELNTTTVFTKEFRKCQEQMWKVYVLQHRLHPSYHFIHITTTAINNAFPNNGVMHKFLLPF